MLWNLPNILTLSRIAAIPVIVALMFVAAPWAAWTALGIYTAACITDWLDGHLARLQHLESPIGRFLDPIADKLLVGALLLTMAGTGRLTFWGLPAAIIILMREILVSGLREYLAGLKQVSLPVSRLAKWKTGLQMVALGLLILWPFVPFDFTWWQSMAEIGLWIAAIITVITGWDYLVTGLRHMTK